MNLSYIIRKVEIKKLTYVNISVIIKFLWNNKNN